jgi:hypothetical protein
MVEESTYSPFLMTSSIDNKDLQETNLPNYSHLSNMNKKAHETLKLCCCNETYEDIKEKGEL